MLISWLYLLLAILTEVAGTLAMNSFGHSGKMGMHLLMFVLISSSYILLSFALKNIAVGIAIAIWEGLGTVLISCISIFFLGEVLTLQKFLGMSLAMIGIVLLHFGEAPEAQDVEKLS
jgi:spermidine export protein MdtJ